MVPKETNLTNGFILISRSLIGSDIWNRPPLYLKVWIFLLTMAQHGQYKQLKRGQLFTTANDIRDACTYYVGCRKEAPSKDQIYKVLRWMSVENSTSVRKQHESNNESNNESGTKAPMIAITKATHGMIITICNFNVYQDPNLYESNNESKDEGGTKATPKAVRTRSRSNNINEECNKNDNNNPPYPLTEFSFGKALEEKILEWVRYKSEKKESYKPTGFKSLLKKIKGNAELYGDQAVITLIDDCMANNWQGIIWDRIKPEKKSGQSKDEEFVW